MVPNHKISWHEGRDSPHQLTGRHQQHQTIIDAAQFATARNPSSHENLLQEGLKAAGVRLRRDGRDGASVVHQRLPSVLDPLRDIVLLQQQTQSRSCTSVNDPTQGNKLHCAAAYPDVAGAALSSRRCAPRQVESLMPAVVSMGASPDASCMADTLRLFA